MASLLMIGLGSFGVHFVRALADSDFYLAAIDSDPGRVEHVKDVVQKPMVGDATLKETLAELAVATYDFVVVSLGDRLDASVLTCLHLKDLKAKQIVVKAADADHARVLSMMGVSRVIFPEREAAEQLAHSVADLNVLRSVVVAPGISLVEMAVPSSFEGKSLGELHLPRTYNVQVALVHQIIPEATVVPTGDFVLKASDTLVLLGSDAALESIGRVR